MIYFLSIFVKLGSNCKLDSKQTIIVTPVIYSIGHSTRSLEEFLKILKENDIEVLVDVRRFPSSKRHPHFDRENLSGELKEQGFEYWWMGESLGGYRSGELGEDSPNQAWESKGFRAYADHALSEEFQGALDKLVEASKSKILALMCAERLFWKCHRRIICDWLLVRGRRVVHILNDEKREHELTRFATTKEGKVLYPNDNS